MNFFLTTPYIIITASIILLYLLRKIGEKTSQRGVTDGLSLIPQAYILVFLWVIYESPVASVSQPVLRSVLMFSMGCAIFVTSSFLYNLNKGGKQ